MTVEGTRRMVKSLPVLIEVFRSKVFIRKKQSTAGDGKSAMGHFTRQGRATNRANACRLVVARSASDPRCRFPASVLFAGGNGNPLSSGRHKWSAERASTKEGPCFPTETANRRLPSPRRAALLFPPHSFQPALLAPARLTRVLSEAPRLAQVSLTPLSG